MVSKKVDKCGYAVTVSITDCVILAAKSQRTYMTFIKKEENGRLMFTCTLTGDARKAVKAFQDEHREKFGENAQMGASRATQILLCELHRLKSAKKG